MSGELRAMRSRFNRGAKKAGKPVVMASKESGKQEPEGDTRLAPDPFTAVLPALAALGAIASIATINWAAQERTPDRAHPLTPTRPRPAPHPLPHQNLEKSMKNQ